MVPGRRVFPTRVRAKGGVGLFSAMQIVGSNLLNAMFIKVKGGANLRPQGHPDQNANRPSEKENQQGNQEARLAPPGGISPDPCP